MRTNLKSTSFLFLEIRIVFGFLIVVAGKKLVVVSTPSRVATSAMQLRIGVLVATWRWIGFSLVNLACVFVRVLKVVINGSTLLLQTLVRTFVRFLWQRLPFVVSKNPVFSLVLFATLASLLFASTPSAVASLPSSAVFVSVLWFLAPKLDLTLV